MPALNAIQLRIGCACLETTQSFSTLDTLFCELLVLPMRPQG